MLDFEDDIVIHMPTSVPTALPEAMQALEQARERRRAELAGWEPSGGWLVNQRNVRQPTRTGTR
ncbi:hypothetical protein JM946_26450 [Steroidobacter sp. S1-65]|uniref:Uncharacterized protein n=1 Tax=Steroidobacter gossypii TaxID=2805490 RepID=A0ABS1X4Y1_9GAMM|nr:hypothetical protein [Steroidobacter gossypii]MBM0108287.1 hypothetical protein [Steroidobacter gossypii]